MKTLHKVLLFGLFGLLYLNSNAQINVPDDYATIQEAINNAPPYGLIDVQNGTYTENLVIDKPLTIRSVFATTNDYSDIENTIIDANFNGSGFQMSDIDGVVHITGFTVINGTGTLYEVIPGVTMENGGGFFAANVDDLYLDNMIIRDNNMNSTNHAGGGIYAENSSVSVYNSEVLNNSTNTESFYGEGAGFKLVDCNTTIYNTVFEGNYSDGYDNGGTVFSMGGELSVSSSIFNQNFGTSGGGICTINCNSSISYCNFTDNECDFKGSAIRAQDYEPLENLMTISNCNFTGNKSISGNTGGTLSFKETNAYVSNVEIIENENGNGGGLVVLNANVEVHNSIISNNLTRYATHSGYDFPGVGAGVYVSQSTLLLKDCDITENECYSTTNFDKGGGFNISYLSDVTIENCTISGNIADKGGAISSDNSTIKIVKTLIYNNFGTQGSLINSSSTDYTFINSTLANNLTIEGETAAIYTNHADSYLFINSILWNPGWNEVFKKREYDNSIFTFSHSDIQGTESLFLNNDLLEKNWLSGNLDSYPQFVDANASDFNLLSSSPLINAGTNYLEIDGVEVLNLEETDYIGPAPEIGAFENETALGFSSQSMEDFIVYPNPTTNFLNFKTTRSIDQVMIYDVTGKLVQKSVPTDNRITLNSLPDGYYWVKLMSNGNQHYKKLIWKSSL